MTGKKPSVCLNCSETYAYEGPLMLYDPTGESFPREQIGNSRNGNTYYNRDDGQGMFQPTKPSLIIGLQNGISDLDNEYIIQFYNRGSKTNPDALHTGIYLGRNARVCVKLESIQENELLPYAKSCLTGKMGQRSWKLFNLQKLCRASLATALLSTGLADPRTKVQLDAITSAHHVRGSRSVEHSMSVVCEEVLKQFPPKFLITADETATTDSEMTESDHTFIKQEEDDDSEMTESDHTFSKQEEGDDSEMTESDHTFSKQEEGDDSEMTESDHTFSKQKEDDEENEIEIPIASIRAAQTLAAMANGDFQPMPAANPNRNAVPSIRIHTADETDAALALIAMYNSHKKQKQQQQS